MILFHINGKMMILCIYKYFNVLVPDTYFGNYIMNIIILNYSDRRNEWYLKIRIGF